VQKSKAEWRARTPPEAYGVLFEEGTERAGTSPLNREKRAGTFVCAACHNPLFRSDAKYESGTGWPSFFEPMPGPGRDEARLQALLAAHRVPLRALRRAPGHVFDDGPEPTGQRYCNNGVALRFVPDGEPLPDLVG
jgi:peptide-methionine (R)-S-oxide reductase